MIRSWIYMIFVKSTKLTCHLFGHYDISKQFFITVRVEN